MTQLPAELYRDRRELILTIMNHHDTAYLMIMRMRDERVKSVHSFCGLIEVLVSFQPFGHSQHKRSFSPCVNITEAPQSTPRTPGAHHIPGPGRFLTSDRGGADTHENNNRNNNSERINNIDDELDRLGIHRVTAEAVPIDDDDDDDDSYRLNYIYLGDFTPLLNNTLSKRGPIKRSGYIGHII